MHKIKYYELLLIWTPIPNFIKIYWTVSDIKHAI